MKTKDLKIGDVVLHKKEDKLALVLNIFDLNECRVDLCGVVDADELNKVSIATIKSMIKSDLVYNGTILWYLYRKGVFTLDDLHEFGFVYNDRVYYAERMICVYGLPCSPCKEVE